MALFFLLVLSLCIPLFNEVDAKSSGGLHRSRELKSTLQHTRDDEFECVDIHKQPAFDHPLLKNHKIQLNTTFTRDRLQSKSSTNVRKGYTITSVSKGCPSGKVPIHKKQTKHHKQISQYSQVYPNHHVATLDTTSNTIFHGAAAGMNAFNLSLQKNQYSLAQIWLQSGPPNLNLNSIQAGWGVHPDLYGNSEARLTGYWTADNFQNTGCFNIFCPGFVQIHPNNSFGDLLTPIDGSGSLAQLDVLILQDQTSGHWWLTVANTIQIGYWPKEILPNLGQGASLIRYGGATFAASLNMNSPPMGSGKLPETKFKNSAFFEEVKFADSQLKLNDVIRSEMKINCDTSPSCYGLWYNGYQGTDYHQAFLYGGPGGQCST